MKPTAIRIVKPPSLLALLGTLGCLTVASAQYATDFESPDFTAGATINGQDSWTSTTPDRARILTAAQIADELTALGMTPGVTVHGGDQALLVSGTGAGSATVRVISGLETEPEVMFEAWVRPLHGTANPVGNVFLTMENAEGTRAAGIRFGPNNSIDYGSAGSEIWRASGKLWFPDTWYRITLRVNYWSGTYDFLLDGVQLNADPIPFYDGGSTSFHQVRIYRGSNQSGVILDDLKVAAAGPRQELFWSETGGFDGPNRGMIYSMAFDASGRTLVASGLNRPIGLAIDVKNGHIYWAEDGFEVNTSRIVRANLDGSEPTTLFSEAEHKFTNAQMLELDLRHGHVYWTDFHQGVIRGNLDGTGYTVLGGSPAAAYYTALALDRLRNHIYFADPTQNGRLFRMNMDGGNRIEVAGNLAAEDWRFNAMTIDALNGYIYYPDAGTHEIKRMNLDGSNQIPLLIDLGLMPYGIALGPNDMMYWVGGSGQRVGAAATDGLSNVNLYLGIPDTATGFGIAAVYAPELPEPMTVTDISLADGAVTITWTGGLPPYQLQRRAHLTEGNWEDVGSATMFPQATDAVTDGAMFYRVEMR